MEVGEAIDAFLRTSASPCPQEPGEHPFPREADVAKHLVALADRVGAVRDTFVLEKAEQFQLAAKLSELFYEQFAGDRELSLLPRRRRDWLDDWLDDLEGVCRGVDDERSLMSGGARRSSLEAGAGHADEDNADRDWLDQWLDGEVDANGGPGGEADLDEPRRDPAAGSQEGDAARQLSEESSESDEQSAAELSGEFSESDEASDATSFCLDEEDMGGPLRKSAQRSADGRPAPPSSVLSTALHKISDALVPLDRPDPHDPETRVLGAGLPLSPEARSHVDAFCLPYLVSRMFPTPYHDEAPVLPGGMWFPRPGGFLFDTSFRELIAGKLNIPLQITMTTWRADCRWLDRFTELPLADRIRAELVPFEAALEDEKFFADKGGTGGAGSGQGSGMGRGRPQLTWMSRDDVDAKICRLFGTKKAMGGAVAFDHGIGFFGSEDVVHMGGHDNSSLLGEKNGGPPAGGEQGGAVPGEPRWEKTFSSSSASTATGRAHGSRAAAARRDCFVDCAPYNGRPQTAFAAARRPPQPIIPQRLGRPRPGMLPVRKLLMPENRRKQLSSVLLFRKGFCRTPAADAHLIPVWWSLSYNWRRFLRHRVFHGMGADYFQVQDGGVLRRRAKRRTPRFLALHRRKEWRGINDGYFVFDPHSFAGDSLPLLRQLVDPRQFVLEDEVPPRLGFFAKPRPPGPAAPNCVKGYNRFYNEFMMAAVPVGMGSGRVDRSAGVLAKQVLDLGGGGAAGAGLGEEGEERRAAVLAEEGEENRGGGSGAAGSDKKKAGSDKNGGPSEENALFSGAAENAPGNAVQQNIERECSTTIASEHDEPECNMTTAATFNHFHNPESADYFNNSCAANNRSDRPPVVEKVETQMREQGPMRGELLPERMKKRVVLHARAKKLMALKKHAALEFERAVRKEWFLSRQEREDRRRPKEAGGASGGTSADGGGTAMQVDGVGGEEQADENIPRDEGDLHRSAGYFPKRTSCPDDDVELAPDLPWSAVEDVLERTLLLSSSDAEDCDVASTGDSDRGRLPTLPSLPLLTEDEYYDLIMLAEREFRQWVKLEVAWYLEQSPEITLFDLLAIFADTIVPALGGSFNLVQMALVQDCFNRLVLREANQVAMPKRYRPVLREDQVWDAKVDQSHNEVIWGQWADCMFTRN